MREAKRATRYQSILCGVDFSTHSAAALRHAAALARAGKARLTAVFAVDPLLSAAAAAAYDTRGLIAGARPELTRFVRATLGPAGAVGVDGLVVIGKPAIGLLSAAERLRADLVVLGTHGLSGVRKLFFGSTTEAMLRRSPVPILAIPRTCRTPRRGWPAGVMVAGVDLDDRAAAEAAAAAGIAKAYGASLTLVHAVPDLRLPGWMRLDERAINRRRVTLAQEWLAARIRVRGRGVAADTHVVVGDRADRLPAFAAAHRADLLILTLPMPGGVGRFHQGAAAYRVVCGARCPVLVLRAIRDQARAVEGRARKPAAANEPARRSAITRRRRVA